MRLATWNINGMNARRGYVETWLREVKPDVVGLQELKMTDDKFPRAELEALGYHAHVHGQKSWNGVAVLARTPGEVRQVGLPGGEELGARLLEVEIDGIAFATIYVPNGKSVEHEDFRAKLSWLDALVSWVKDSHRPDEPFVLCGDFNIVPASLDSWNEGALLGGIFHTVAERERIGALTAWGLRDVYRDRYPDKPGYTWWDYRGGAFHRKQGLRIDLMMATAPVAERVTEAYIDRRWRKKVEGMIASDHAPLWVDLDGEPASADAAGDADLA